MYWDDKTRFDVDKAIDDDGCRYKGATSLDTDTLHIIGSCPGCGCVLSQKVSYRITGNNREAVREWSEPNHMPFENECLWEKIRDLESIITRIRDEVNV